MDINPTAQSPEEYEQRYLPQLEQFYLDIQHQFAAYLGNRLLTAQELAALVQLLQRWEKTFETYTPWAQYLWDAGRSQMARRLAAILTDLHGALEIILQMQQNASAHQNTLYDIQHSAQTESFRLYMETMARVRQRRDEMLNRWSAATFNYCPHCGLHVGSYLTYPICPHCGRSRNW